MTIDCTKDLFELVRLLLRVELGDLLFIDLRLQNAVANCSKINVIFRTFFLNLGAALDQCVEAKFDGAIWKILNLVQDFVPLDCQIIIC